jgi:hypothetical protein
MSALTYFVPDLALIKVAMDVPELVRSSIEFQLGHFAVADQNRLPGWMPLITVEPYRRLTGGNGEMVFHALRAERCRLLHSPDGRHATRRTADGFAIYSDTPDVLIVLLLQTLALRQGRTFLHAAGWCDATGAVTLLPGPGGVGKTALLSAAVLRHDARLLGDDLVLVGKAGRAQAFPRAFVLKDYHRGLFPEAFEAVRRSELQPWRPVIKFLRENAPFHGLLKSFFRKAGRLESASSWLQMRATRPEYKTVPVARLFGADRVAAGGLVARVVYVERYSGTVFRLSVITREEVARRSLAVLHHEWVDYLRWFFALGAVELIDLGAHFRETESAMLAGFAGAPLHLLQVPEGASPEELEQAFATHLGFASVRA